MVLIVAFYKRNGHGKSSKLATLIVVPLIAMLLLCTFVALDVNASTHVPTPETPQVTVKVLKDPGLVELSIKKQIFSPPYGDDYIVHYNVRVKGHDEQNWTELYYSFSDQCPTKSDSAITTISYGGDYVKSKGPVDFQVRAIFGDYYSYYTQNVFFCGPWRGDYYVVSMSGWSKIQTVTLVNTTISPTITPSVTPVSTDEERSNHSKIWI